MTVESSREMRVSRITCDDCEYTLHGTVNEDALIKKWNKLIYEFIKEVKP